VYRTEGVWGALPKGRLAQREEDFDLGVQQWHKFPPFCAKCGEGWVTDAVFCCQLKRTVMQATLQPPLRGIESLPTSFETTGGGEKV